MSEIIIERARPEDAAQLLDHLRTVGAETDNLTFGAEGLPFTVGEEAAYIENLAQSEKNVMLVARENGRIIGNGSLNGLPRRMSHRAELAISVIRECWSRGVGSMLMDALIAHGKASGYTVISLEVRSDNTHAIKLYQKFGFQKICTYPCYMKIDGIPVDVDLMYLPL